MVITEHTFTDIRMVGGVTDNQGAVEVQMNGRWGRICQWPGLRTAGREQIRTLCRSVGYTYVLVEQRDVS